LGFPSIYAHTFDAELPYLTWQGNTYVTRRAGEVRASWGQPRLPPQESRVTASVPQFGGGGSVYLPTSFNAE